MPPIKKILGKKIRKGFNLYSKKDKVILTIEMPKINNREI